MAELQEVPVYLFTGFLESGKTEFVNESVLSDPSFVGSENTLLLVCEEGEEEYDAEALKKKKVFVEVVENEIDLSAKILTYLLNKNHCTRVLMEYNGMWLLNSFYNNLPDNWVIYQEFMFADATTFLNYNNNMRQLVVDKLQSCDLAVFNRFTKKMNQMDYHKIVRAVSRRAQIAYEYVDGDIVNDDIQDPLPFDINAPIIEVKDDHREWRVVLVSEAKHQGKDIENIEKGKLVGAHKDQDLMAAGNAIERAHKNVSEIANMMLGESYFPYILFLEGSNFLTETIHVTRPDGRVVTLEYNSGMLNRLDRLTAANYGMPINTNLCENRFVPHGDKMIMLQAASIYTQGDGKRWERERMLKIMIDVAETSLKVLSKDLWSQLNNSTDD